MKIPGMVAVLLSAGLLLTGCGSSTQTTPAESSPSASAVSSPTPVASDDVCGLLSPDEINEVLGTQFPAGEQTSDDARQIVTCTYTMVDSSTGVDLPVAIVNVGVSLIDGQESYETNVDLAPAYFGDEAQDTEVPGASQAYILTNEQTNSPVIGMLVGERFVQIQIGVENSTDDQAKTLAAMVAARVS